ncbi:autotransporter outer membrane beta-barrel domain-containing protein [Bartonella sp. B1099]|uniref:autotransporter outer membrane beta-barrel domain-containing protein n=1 Tax=Bartonella sp. B1099 TaxID=2911422 RepID=UPI0020C232F2|nr:autotransporter outer membrane beta-barrel domain-containing protein [Bartonella sp. B1099]
MYKKSLLSSMATAAIVLFNIQFNVHAESLEVSGEKKEIKEATYETLHALKGGQIIGTDLKVTGNKDTNSSSHTDVYVISVEGKGSAIKLTGDKTTIKGTDSDIRLGLEVKDDAILQMTGGIITVSDTGVHFLNSNSQENKLENVTISSGKNDVPLRNGIITENSTVTLKNVTVSQVVNAIVGDDHSQITITGGSFESTNDSIYAKQGSSITLNNATVTSYGNNGVYADGLDSKIIMIGGSATTKNKHSSALLAKNKGSIDATDITLTTNGTGTGAFAYGEKSTIELHGNTTINNTFNGLGASVGGKITSENLTIIGGTAGNLENPEAQSGVWVGESGEINLIGKTIISNFDEGLYADSGGKIVSGDLTITALKGKNIGIGVLAKGSNSKIELKGTTTIQQLTNGIEAENAATVIAKDLKITCFESSETEFNTIGFGIKARESIIELNGNTIIENVFNTGLAADLGGKITSKNLTVIGTKSINPNSEHDRYGISTWNPDSEINLTGTTTIKNLDIGLSADDGGKIVSHDLTIIGGESEKITIGVESYEDGIIELNGNTTIQNVDLGLVADENGVIKTGSGTKNEIKAKKNALAVVNGGHMDLTNVSATAEVSGLQFANFSDNDPLDPMNPQEYRNNEINLNHSIFHVDNGTGIFVGAVVEKNIENSPALSIGTLNFKDSEIYADILLDNGIFWDKISWKDKNVWDGKEVKEIPIGSFTLNADHSTLEGRANITKERNVRFDLKNGTQWFLKNSTQEKDDDGKLLDIAQRSRSDISVLDLENSSVIFQEPTEGHYHTLYIGSGKPETKAVYNATGNAQISFNTWWSDGKPIVDQKTDRLLINGDVSGTTNIFVNLKGNTTQQKPSDVEKNIRGLSLIQVSGTAEESSFKLAHGYTTINGSPDKYMLRVYGPNSSQGKADIKQNLFDEKNENFWDFRLQPEFLNSNPETGSNPEGSGSNPESGSHPEANVHAPVAQMASYLVMPNALFYSGLTDMAKQNALLANIRTSVVDKGQEKQNGFFLHTYGSTGTFSSESAPRQYGYSGADLRYAALQGGVNFATLEGHNTTTRFGLLGTYGQLSFTPKNMRDAGKNTVDKWSLTAYGTIQYDNGFYLDTLLSYGFLKGEITNALIGTTAKLKNAKMLNISTTVGKQFATGIQGVTFEPQAQLAYQHLTFDTIADADNFTVDMQNPHQWMIRIGGRLTKSISTENNRPMSFYGKVNLIKTFRDDQSLHIDKDYKLDAMGSALEGGLGINAQLSTNLSLHGDVSYQQKLQKTGISGASFSGGIRYQF